MNAQSMIDQLLKAGLQALDGATASVSKAGVDPAWSQYATGAAAGSVLGLLLGSRGGRQLGGTVLKLGSMAALGRLAWTAWQEHLARQAGAGPGSTHTSTHTPTQTPIHTPPAPPLQNLPPAQAEQHGRALLKALIAAAKSDGHLDDRERGLVDAELRRSEAEPALRAWVEAELARPVDAADVAAGCSSPEMAAELYLSSLIVVDQTNATERAYLDELARQLNLPADLKADLETRASAA